jgi:hypothetical protein
VGRQSSQAWWSINLKGKAEHGSRFFQTEMQREKAEISLFGCPRAKTLLLESCLIPGQVAVALQLDQMGARLLSGVLSGISCISGPWC